MTTRELLPTVVWPMPCHIRLHHLFSLINKVGVADCAIISNTALSLPLCSDGWLSGTTSGSRGCNLQGACAGGL